MQVIDINYYTRIKSVLKSIISNYPLYQQVDQQKLLITLKFKKLSTGLKHFEADLGVWKSGKADQKIFGSKKGWSTCKLPQGFLGIDNKKGSPIITIGGDFMKWNKIENSNYEVSDTGLIRNSKTGTIRKAHINASGYFALNFVRDGLRKNFRIHRLVAEAFIPNTNNYPCINHKDENKLNNNVDNLEWCTYKYNNNYGDKNIRSAQKLSKPIIQYDTDLNFIKEWNSINEASEKLKLGSSHISQCCSGSINKQGKKYKTVGGFIWRYKN